MSGKSFSYSKVLGFGWCAMKSNFCFFIGVGVVSFLTPLLLEIAAALLLSLFTKVLTPFWIDLVVGVVCILLIILIIGFIRITLRFCDGQKPRFSTLFSGWDCFWRFFAAGFLYNLILNVIPLVCILPFAFLYGAGAMHHRSFVVLILAAIEILVIIVAIKFGLCFYFVVDKGLGPINALKASSRATEGAKWSLFVFGILCVLINLAGALCFLIGLFATVPTVMVAMALAYRHLSEQTPELADLGISSPNAKTTSAVGSPLNTGGIQLAPAIQAVVNARPDQNIQSRVGVQPAADNQSSTAAQSGHSIRPEQGVQPASDITREGEKKTDKSFFFWLAVLVIVSVALAAGVIHRLWSRSKDNATLSPNNGVADVLKKVAVASRKAAATPKEVTTTAKDATASPNGTALKVILYSEDNPSALIGDKILKEGDTIDGVKVVKINKDSVEFEKDGQQWTQRMK